MRGGSVGDGHMVLARDTHIFKDTIRQEPHTHAEGAVIASKTAVTPPNQEGVSFQTLSSLAIGRVTWG